MTRPLGRDRWLYRLDNVVHRVLAAYAARFDERDGGIRPRAGFTECGLFVRDTAVGDRDRNRYVSDNHFVSCIMCASERCTAGLLTRQAQKINAFGILYGRSGLTLAGTTTGRMTCSGSNVSQVPRSAPSTTTYSLKQLSEMFLLGVGNRHGYDE